MRFRTQFFCYDRAHTQQAISAIIAAHKEGEPFVVQIGMPEKDPTARQIRTAWALFRDISAKTGMTPRGARHDLMMYWGYIHEEQGRDGTVQVPMSFSDMSREEMSGLIAHCENVIATGEI